MAVSSSNPVRSGSPLKRWLLAVGVAAGGSAAAGCTRTEATPQPGNGSSGRGRDQENAVPVVTARAEVKTIPVTLDAVGTVEAIATVEIRAQVTGQSLPGHHGGRASISTRPISVVAPLRAQSE